MANYEIPENPVYNPDIRRLEDSDPASASDTFNPLIQQLIDNTHAVKQSADSKIAAVETKLNDMSSALDKAQQIIDSFDDIKKSVDGMKMFLLNLSFDQRMAGMPFTVTGGGLGTYSGTVPETLSAMVRVPDADTTYTVKCGDTVKNVMTGSCYGIYYAGIDVVSTVLAKNSWEQIAAVSAAGKARDYWKLGDEIDITVNGETITMQIYDFNHDNLTGGGKAGITFGMKNLMAEPRPMYTKTNTGGFTGTELYSWMQNTLYPALPENLKAVIKPVDKKTCVGGGSSVINTDSMKLFLFSEIEYNGTEAFAAKGEGEPYPIFTDNASRVKTNSNGKDSEKRWWGRSQHPTYLGSFCFVEYDGHAYHTGAGNKFGICFGFCV